MKQELGVMTHTYNPSIWGAEAGGWRAQGQPRLHNQILSQDKQTNNQTMEQKTITTSPKKRGH
jgi:hypothetical protein